MAYIQWWRWPNRSRAAIKYPAYNQSSVLYLVNNIMLQLLALSLKRKKKEQKVKIPGHSNCLMGIEIFL